MSDENICKVGGIRLDLSDVVDEVKKGATLTEAQMRTLTWLVFHKGHVSIFDAKRIVEYIVENKSAPTSYKKEYNKCPECKSANQIIIWDHPGEMFIQCKDCKKDYDVIKSGFIDEFLCEKCGSTSGSMHDGKDVITMVCNDCKTPQVVFVKEDVAHRSMTYSNELQQEIPTKSTEEIYASLGLPQCPTCKSYSVKKISGIKRAAYGSMFGLFSKTAKSQFECKNCGYKW